MSTDAIQEPWDIAADQIEELVLSAMARKVAGLEAPSGRISAIVRESCEQHAAALTQEIQKRRDWIAHLQEERAALTQENQRLRNALRAARPLVEDCYRSIQDRDEADALLAQIDAALTSKEAPAPTHERREIERLQSEVRELRDVIRRGADELRHERAT